MTDEFLELGTTFSKEMLIACFLNKIENRHQPSHSYQIFYNIMRLLPKGQRRFEYVKSNFLVVDNSQITKRKGEQFHDGKSGTKKFKSHKESNTKKYGGRALKHTKNLPLQNKSRRDFGNENQINRSLYL